MKTLDFYDKAHLHICSICLRLDVSSLLGDSLNYLPLILVPFPAKRIGTQILVIAKLNGRKDFILRGFIFNIIRPSKKLPVQS